VTTAILKLESVSKTFGGLRAVGDVSFAVPERSIFGLIGPNGAGKTTVFNLLTKFLKPTSGAIVFKGKDITRRNAADVARLGMVRSFQISAVFPHMTARENVRVALQRPLGTSYHFWRSLDAIRHLDARADAILASVGLGEHAGLFAAELPYGRKRALEIATTLALDPELLLLDEPMAGLGQEDIRRISTLIRAIAKNRTVLMVEHNLSVVAELSDMITVLTRGQILAEGTYREIAANAEVREAYLGTGHG